MSAPNQSLWLVEYDVLIGQAEVTRPFQPLGRRGPHPKEQDSEEGAWLRRGHRGPLAEEVGKRRQEATHVYTGIKY